MHHPVYVNVDWELEDAHHFFFQCSLCNHLRHDLMAKVQLGWADSGNDGHWYTALSRLELLLMPCMDDRLSRPSCERIISALPDGTILNNHDANYNDSLPSSTVQQQQHLCRVTIDDSVFLTPQCLNYSVDTPGGGYKTCLITA